jgi:hypothetical protein
MWAETQIAPPQIQVNTRSGKRNWAQSATGSRNLAGQFNELAPIALEAACCVAAAAAAAAAVAAVNHKTKTQQQQSSRLIGLIAWRCVVAAAASPLLLFHNAIKAIKSHKTFV